jgi:hypothetical protein
MDLVVCPHPPFSLLNYLDPGLPFISLSLSLSLIHGNGDVWAAMAIGVGAAKTGSNGGKAGSSDQEVRCGELQWHLSFSDALVSDRGGGADGLNRPVGGLAGLIHYYLHT